MEECGRSDRGPRSGNFLENPALGRGAWGHPRGAGGFPRDLPGCLPPEPHLRQDRREERRGDAGHVYPFSATIGMRQAEEVMGRWQAAVQANKPFVLGLATGSTPEPLLGEMAGS